MTQEYLFRKQVCLIYLAFDLTFTNNKEVD